MKKSHSFAVNGALACGVLYFVYDLSRSGRTVIDWIVIGLVSAAILWNLLNLSQRLVRAGGARNLWHLAGTVALWVVGLVLITQTGSGSNGSWQRILGVAVLVGAAAYSVVVYRAERSSTESESRAAPADPQQDE